MRGSRLGLLLKSNNKLAKCAKLGRNMPTISSHSIIVGTSDIRGGFRQYHRTNYGLSSNDYELNQASGEETETNASIDADDDNYFLDNTVKGCIVEYFDKTTKGVKLGLFDEKEMVIHQQNFTTIRMQDKMKNKDIVIIDKWTNILTTFTDFKEIKERATYFVLDQTYYVDFELRLENLLIEAFTSGKKFTSLSLAAELFDSGVPLTTTRYIAFYLVESSGCFTYDPKTNRYTVIETDTSQIRIQDFMKRAKSRIQEIEEYKKKHTAPDQTSIEIMNHKLSTKWDPIIDVPILRKLEFFILTNNTTGKNRRIIDSVLTSFGYPKNRRGAAQFLHAIGHMQIEKSASIIEGGVGEESNIKEYFPSIFKKFAKEVESAAQKMSNSHMSIIEKESLSSSRKDLRHLRAIAIDSISTQAYDDAISLEMQGNTLKIYVHVCDISAFVSKGDPNEIEARSRNKTIYSKNGVRSMLHPQAIKSMTLTSERNNLSLTLEMTFTREGDRVQMQKYEFYRSTLSPVELFTYNTVDGLFDQYLRQNIKNSKDKKPTPSPHQLLTDMFDNAMKIDQSLNMGLATHTKSTPAQDMVSVIMTMANNVIEAHIKQLNLQHLFPKTSNFYRFTSPMRRYGDLVTHVQYVALMGMDPNKIDTSLFPYTEKDIKQINNENQAFEKDLLESKIIMDKKKREGARKQITKPTTSTSNRVVGHVIKKRKGMSSVYIPAMDKTISVHLVEYDEVNMLELLLEVLPDSEKTSLELLGWTTITKKMKENREPNDIREGSKVLLNIKHIEYYDNDPSMKAKNILADHVFEERVDNYTI